jgi:hypothetical protein
MPEMLRWYSMTSSLETQEHDFVSLEQALEIGRDRYSKAGRKYDKGEDAIADTMFGFFRDEKTFLELCVNGFSDVSLRFETPRTGGSWLNRLTSSTISIEKTLKDPASMEVEITAFFSMSPEQFRKHLDA